MDKEILKSNYEKACNEYLKAFCEKHGFDFQDSYWIGDRIGEIADVCSYCVDMQTIVDDIDLEASEDEFLTWYYYCMLMRELDFKENPNFRSWIRGCPRKSEQEIEELAKRKIEELKEELIKQC